MAGEITDVEMRSVGDALLLSLRTGGVIDSIRIVYDDPKLKPAGSGFAIMRGGELTIPVLVRRRNSSKKKPAQVAVSVSLGARWLAANAPQYSFNKKHVFEAYQVAVELAQRAASVGETVRTRFEAAQALVDRILSALTPEQAGQMSVEDDGTIVLRRDDVSITVVPESEIALPLLRLFFAPVEVGDGKK